MAHEHARDDLEPVPAALQRGGKQGDYDVALRRVLLDRAPRPRPDGVQMLIRPSFERELLVTLSQRDAGWSVHVLQPERQLWEVLHEPNSGDVAAVRCAAHERAVPAAFGARAARVVQRMLLRTRYQPREGVVLDGVAFTFLGWVKGAGELAGETSNPVAGTRTDALARIATACAAFARAADGERGEQNAQMHALGQAVAELERALDEAAPLPR